MQNLLDYWEKAKSIFGDPIFLLTDFDGTLTPIVERPEAAELSPEMRDVISSLVPLCPVGIISGRSISDLKSRIDIENVYYSGNHGFEIEGPGIEFVMKEAEEARDTIEKFCNEFERKIGMEDVVVENKGYTASVHYRLLSSEEIPQLREKFHEIVRPYLNNTNLEVNEGKKIYEIRPSVNWDKGKAVSFLLTNLSYEEETLPIYLGDDVTDEDAFRDLEGGIGIFVGDDSRETRADFALENVDEVRSFFEKLIKILS